MEADEMTAGTRRWSADTGRKLRTLAVRGLVLSAAVRLVPVAAAHEGSVHAGVPHRVLLAGVVLGGGILAGSLYLARHSWADRPRRTLTGAFVGLGIATLSLIGLIEIQVEPTTATLLFREWYPVIAFATGTSIMLGSLVLGLRRWPHRPLYTLIGVLLGLWVGYPVLVPGIAIQHPLGYLLAASLPLVLGYVLWRDVVPAFASTDALARRAGLAAGGIFTVFFLFSTGLLSFNPDEGVNAPTEAFVTVEWFGNPLVLWPAVEFYVPSVPVFGAMSVGTAIALVILGAATAASLTHISVVLNYGGQIPWNLLAMTVPAVLIGGQLAGWLAGRVSENVLRHSLAGFLVVLALITGGRVVISGEFSALTWILLGTLLLVVGVAAFFLWKGRELKAKFCYASGTYYCE